MISKWWHEREVTGNISVTKCHEFGTLVSLLKMVEWGAGFSAPV
jgi:hypothetical protein